MGPKVRPRLANGARENLKKPSNAITRTERPALLAIFETSFVNTRAGRRGGNHEAHLFFRLSGRDEDRGGYGAPGLPSPMVQLSLEAAQLHAASFAPQAALETHAVRGQSRGAQKLGLGQTALVASTRSTSREGSQNPVA